jgi:hypothetical protein
MKRGSLSLLLRGHKGSMWPCGDSRQCDYPGCSDRGFPSGCSIWGWPACYYVSTQASDEHFCNSSCTGAPSGYGQENWSTFCPAPTPLATCSSSGCQFYAYSGVLSVYNADCARSACVDGLDLRGAGLYGLHPRVFSDFSSVPSL